jgi:integrase
MAIYPDKKNGALTGRYRVEVQYKGKRLRGRFPSLEEAQRVEADWKQGIEQNFIAPSSRHTLPLTLEEVVRLAERTLWRGKTTEDESIVKLHKVVDIIGPKLPPMTLSTLHIDKLVATLLDDDKSPKTVNRYLSAFHKLYAWACDRGYMQEGVKFTWEDEGEGRIRWITPEEEQALYRHMEGSPVAVLVRAAIRTGMRRSELLRLSKKDVEAMWVRAWETKNGSHRSVPITPDTRADLLWLIDHGMPTIAEIRYQWAKAKKAMGLEQDPNFVFHACRHTCATRLVEANVHLTVVQKFMGHKRIETTLRYAHVNDTLLTDALAKVTSSPTPSLGSPKVPHPEFNAEVGPENPMIT